MSWYSDKYPNKGSMDSRNVEFYRYFKKVPKRMLNTGCVEGGPSTIDPEHIWCCDVDTDLIRNARKRGLHADYVDLNKRTKYPLNFFDAIYSYGVLEHMKEPIVAMEEFHRTLKPGGKLVLGVPDIKKMGFAFWDSFQHFSPISKTGLGMLAYQVGFREYKVHDEERKFRGMNWLAKKTSPDFVISLQNFLYHLRIRSRDMIILEATKN